MAFDVGRGAEVDVWRVLHGKEVGTMSTTRVSIDPEDSATLRKGRIDPAVVDGTTESEVALPQREDDAEAMQDAVRYARRVRRRLGSARWSWRGEPTCRTRRSATGNG